jgi:hypothetical protein
MTVDPTTTSAASAGLVDRVKNILLTPKAEWARIAAETPNVNNLYVGYALPIIAIGAVCSIIGQTLVGGMFGHAPIVWAVAMALFGAAIQLVCIFVGAVIANALAPSFGSRQDMGRAHQLLVYGSTASMVAGILSIIPPLAILGILAGLYGIILIYFGMPFVMNTPTDKQVVYTLVLVIAYVVVFWVLTWIVGIITLSLGFSALGAAANAFSVPK